MNLCSQRPILYSLLFFQPLSHGKEARQELHSVEAFNTLHRMHLQPLEEADSCLLIRVYQILHHSQFQSRGCILPPLQYYLSTFGLVYFYLFVISRRYHCLIASCYGDFSHTQSLSKLHSTSDLLVWLLCFNRLIKQGSDLVLKMSLRPVFFFYLKQQSLRQHLPFRSQIICG